MSRLLDEPDSPSDGGGVRLAPAKTGLLQASVPHASHRIGCVGTPFSSVQRTAERPRTPCSWRFRGRSSRCQRREILHAFDTSEVVVPLADDAARVDGRLVVRKDLLASLRPDTPEDRPCRHAALLSRKEESRVAEGGEEGRVEASATRTSACPVQHLRDQVAIQQAPLIDNWRHARCGALPFALRERVELQVGTLRAVGLQQRREQRPFPDAPVYATMLRQLGWTPRARTLHVSDRRRGRQLSRAADVHLGGSIHVGLLPRSRSSRGTAASRSCTLAAVTATAGTRPSSPPPGAACVRPPPSRRPTRTSDAGCSPPPARTASDRGRRLRRTALLLAHLVAQPVVEFGQQALDLPAAGERVHPPERREVTGRFADSTPLSAT